MVRTFHHQFSIGSKCGLLLLSVLAVYLFWVKAVVFGLLLVVVVVMMTERVLHSEYVFTADSLVIRRGRFARQRSIRLADISSCRPMTTTFGMVRYLLIGYGSDRLVAVQPADEASFVACLQRRLKVQRAAHAGTAEPQAEGQGREEV